MTRQHISKVLSPERERRASETQVRTFTLPPPGHNSSVATNLCVPQGRRRCIAPVLVTRQKGTAVTPIPPPHSCPAPSSSASAVPTHLLHRLLGRTVAHSKPEERRRVLILTFPQGSRLQQPVVAHRSRLDTRVLIGDPMISMVLPSTRAAFLPQSRCRKFSRSCTSAAVWCSVIAWILTKVTSLNRGHPGPPPSEVAPPDRRRAAGDAGA